MAVFLRRFLLKDRPFVHWNSRVLALKTLYPLSRQPNMDPRSSKDVPGGNNTKLGHVPFVSNLRDDFTKEIRSETVLAGEYSVTSNHNR